MTIRRVASPGFVRDVRGRSGSFAGPHPGERCERKRIPRPAPAPPACPPAPGPPAGPAGRVLGLHGPPAGGAKVVGKAMSPTAAALRRRIGYIPTSRQFPKGMSPIVCLGYMARLFGLPRDVRKPRLASLIRAVDLLAQSGQ